MDDKQQTLSRLFSGRFEVLEPLPWNGLAIVHAAHGLMHRDLALAVLPVDCGSNPEHSRLFHQSFAAIRDLGYQGGVPIHDLGVQKGVPLKPTKLCFLPVLFIFMVSLRLHFSKSNFSRLRLVTTA